MLNDTVTIPRQSRALSVVSPSKRLNFAANAALFCHASPAVELPKAAA
jgi:hypothetical protein